MYGFVAFRGLHQFTNWRWRRAVQRRYRASDGGSGAHSSPAGPPDAADNRCYACHAAFTFADHICFTLGGGKSGVIAAVALTHWPRLALILRADAERVAQSDYLTLTYRLGHGHLYCWRYHYFPALLPQWLTGTLLMFPHAVLHSAALSFLGFGLAPHEPSLGLLLADALRFISHGNWWLVLFPGLMLFTLVMLFDQFARAIQRLWLRSDVC